MVEFATQYEVDNFREFELKRLTPFNALDFAIAQNESYEVLANYFDEVYFSRPRPFIEIFNDFMSTLKSGQIDLYGLYRENRLLGIGSYHYLPYSNYGCEVVYWMRKSEIGKKIGAYFLKKLTLYAIYEKNFRFVQLLVDESNLVSRAVASKIGYEHIESYESHTAGKSGSGTYCRYICFDAQIDDLAESHGLRKVDLMDHPGYHKEFRHLLFDEELNEECRWPYPVIEQRKKVEEAKKIRHRKTPYRIPILSNSPIPKYKEV